MNTHTAFRQQATLEYRWRREAIQVTLAHSHLLHYRPPHEASLNTSCLRRLRTQEQLLIMLVRINSRHCSKDRGMGPLLEIREMGEQVSVRRILQGRTSFPRYRHLAKEEGHCSLGRLSLPRVLNRQDSSSRGELRISQRKEIQAQLPLKKVKAQRK